MSHATSSLNSSKSIMISGWYGADNAGDDAILEQFITEMVNNPTLRLFVLTELPERVEQRYGAPNIAAIFHGPPGLGSIKRFLRGETQKRLRTLRSCDLFVLGGGGILRDNTSYSNLIRILDEIWIAKLLGTK